MNLTARTLDWQEGSFNRFFGAGDFMMMSDNDDSVLREWVLDNREVKSEEKCHSLFSRSASEIFFT